jgi:hypothetical protein
MATLKTDLAFSSNKALAQLATPITVEVAPKPASAKVVREGFQVPIVALNAQAASFFLDNLPVVLPRQTPRVVSQSIAAGLRATAGTVVDLVLAPVSDIPFGIFDGVHRDLKQRNVATLLDGMLAQPDIRQLVLKYDDPTNVPLADRTVLTQQFRQSADIAIDDTNVETGFAAAFQAARVALAFK